jgi:hypothetical protein
MPAPGSQHALVLPASFEVADGLDPVAVAATSLAPFLDKNKYEVVAIAHGLSRSAAKAFGLAKLRLTPKRGAVWVTDKDLVAQLTGAGAADMKRMLRPVRGFVLTFWNVPRKRVAAKVRWQQLNSGRVHAGFVQAAGG